MPGMDGIAAAREITGTRRAAVLILTAFSQRDLVEQATDAGAFSYLVKPYQTSELIPAIEVALGRFADMRALEAEVEGTKERLDTQRIVGRAKGILMDRDKMSEADAFSYIQKTAMKHRAKMRTVAQQIIDGTLPAD
jgi:AmiR/NasT family two-component response regulator